jgi:SAM-dependent methyltransferase
MIRGHRSPRSAAGGDGLRRLRPRLWDADWLVLRGLTREIDRLAAIVTSPGLSVLDFGCGDKPYASLFVGRGARYAGADFGTGHEVAVDSDGNLEAPDGSFDLVVSFQVLEHVRDLGTYFSEMRRVLRPEGRLILSTHGSWFYHPDPEDHRRWTREGLMSELRAHGFEPVECRGVVGPLAYTTIVRLMMVAYVLRAVPVAGPTVARCLAVLTNARARLEDAATPTRATRDNACVYVTLSRRSQA